jgi:hypothetical protein
VTDDDKAQVIKDTLDEWTEPLTNAQRLANGYSFEVQPEPLQRDRDGRP